MVPNLGCWPACFAGARELDGQSTLQNRALALLAGLALADLQEGSAGSGLEDLTDTLVGTGRALQVLVGTNLLADLLTLHKAR